MHTSIKPLPKPPNVPSASRILRSMSADDLYPIGVKWNPFLALGLTRKNSSPLPSLKGRAPLFRELACISRICLHVKDG